MATIYSTRFIATAPGGSGGYTVPASSKAVVRSVQAVNTGTSTTQWWYVVINPGSYYIAVGQLQAWLTNDVIQTQNMDLRAVVNGGETINASGAPGVVVVVSGYLFAS